MAHLYSRLGLFALAWSLSSIQVQASPITFTIATTATGTLGASHFTNASVVLTLTGDTSAVTAGPGLLSSYLIDPGTTTLTIGGLGSASFTDSIEIVSSFSSPTFFGQPPTVVIVDTTNGGPGDPTGILETISPTFLGYNLQSALGPISGTGSVANQGPVDGFFSTTAGNLQFAAGQGNGAGTSTFTATITPEPETFGLIAAGVAAILGRYRFKRR